MLDPRNWLGFRIDDGNPEIHVRRDDSMQRVRERRYLERTVGELVAEHYGRAAVFAAAGIDFCCGGGRTVTEACAETGVAAGPVVEALDALDAAGGEPSGSDVRAWSIGRLVSHIEDVHHAYLRRTIPVLGQWTEKISRVHGRAHPELLEVRALFEELAEELSRHMRDEEDEVFPHLVALEDAADDDVELPVPKSVVDALEDDHEHAGSLTRRIRELTHGFSPPADACTTYTATLALLNEFEQDLHRHVHLENNVLFPRAREASARRGNALTDDTGSEEIDA